MIDSVRIMGRILLYGVAAIGACIWILRFPLMLDWAYEEPKSALSKNDWPDFSKGIIQLAQAGTLFAGFIGQTAIANFSLDEIIKKEHGSSSQPSDFNRRYLLASISKTITAIIFGQLFEEGILRENDQFCLKMELFCQPPTNKITIKDLLDHRSGLPRNSAHQLFGEFPDFASFLVAMDPKNSDLKNIQSFKVSPPNRAFHYSNLGYRYLSYLLEKVLGKSFTEIVEERIAKRYALPSVSVAHDANYSQMKTTYSIGLNPNLSFVTSQKILPNLEMAPYGDGAVIASLNDLLALSKLIIDKKIFITAEMHRKFFDEPQGYTLGLLHGFDEEKNPYYFHNGAYFGSSTLWYIFPKQQIVILMLSNMGYQRSEIAGFIADLKNAVLSRAYHEPVKARKWPAINL